MIIRDTSPEKTKERAPVVAQRKCIRLVSMRIWVPSLASISGLRIQRCHELWHRLQTWLRSHVAVAVV